MKVLFVGTFTQQLPFVNGRGLGVHAFSLNRDKANITLHTAKTVPVGVNPSFLTAVPVNSNTVPCKQFVYVCTEEYTASEGSLYAFGIGADPGETWNLIGVYSTVGLTPCYASSDKTHQFLFVANYVGGSVVSFAIETDGGLSLRSHHKWEGCSGAVPERQETPHAHAIRPHPHIPFVYATDLGNDRIYIYRLEKDGVLTASSKQPHICSAKGAGPRHLEFHPSGTFLYVTCELNATVVTYKIAQEDGSLHEHQVISTVPSEFHDFNLVADIHITGNGRFVYVSNRGHDSLTIFAIDQNEGTLSLIEHVSAMGKSPRNFVIEDDLLLVANQDSDEIVAFHINERSGRLTYSGNKFPCATPVCLQLAEF